MLNIIMRALQLWRAEIWQKSFQGSLLSFVVKTLNKRVNAWTNKALLGSYLTNFGQPLLARYARRYVFGSN